MACRRCSICSVNYPLGQEFQKCKCCGEKTDSINESDPHDDWAAQVDRYHGVFKVRALPPLNITHVVQYADQAWVTDVQLRDAGYWHAGIGTILRVVGPGLELFFEINGKAVPLNGDPMSPHVDGWWIARVNVEDEVEAAFADVPITDPADGR